jgi:hypothetical protein
VEFHVEEDEDTEEAAQDTDFQRLTCVGDGRQKEKEHGNQKILKPYWADLDRPAPFFFLFLVYVRGPP